MSEITRLFISGFCLGFVAGAFGIGSEIAINYTTEQLVLIAGFFISVAIVAGRWNHE